jgi:hypothetical protein
MLLNNFGFVSSVWFGYREHESTECTQLKSVENKISGLFLSFYHYGCENSSHSDSVQAAYSFSNQSDYVVNRVSKSITFRTVNGLDPLFTFERPFGWEKNLKSHDEHV